MEPKQKTTFRTFQSMYHEERSADDGLSYYYIAFTMNIDAARAIHLLKFSGSDMKIVWHI